MSKFIIFWSCGSPGCLSLIVSANWFYQLGWHPGYPDIRISIAIYLVYWLLLGTLQGGALFWEFQNRKFAYHWFLTTTTTGFFVMLIHELPLIGMTTTGQGELILLFTLPCLAVLGGLILGVNQFLLIRKCNLINQRLNNLVSVGFIWFTISFLSWAIGFAGILFMSSSFNTPTVWILLVMGGSAMKGWFIQKYLRA